MTMEQDNLLQTENLANNEAQVSGAIVEEPRTEAPIQEETTSAEKSTEKEIPAWDFASFTTEEIISHMKEMIESFPVQQLKMLDNLPAIFEKQYKNERDQALASFTGAGNPSEDFEYASDAK